MTTVELYYTVFYTVAGWIGVAGSQEGLRRIILPRQSEEDVCRVLGISPGEITPGRFTDIIARLRAYFSGEKVTFHDALDLSGATPFQRDVWRETALIPFGETRSYGWIAGRTGKPRAARAVGQVLGRNPLPIVIPCHRVVSADGGPGGFTGGLPMKRLLLELEAKAVDGGG